MSTADASCRSWLERPPARWSMPVSLQPRAACRIRLLRAEDQRPVRPTRRGYPVRPHGRYRLEFAFADDADQPSRIAIISGLLRRTSDQEERVTEDGHTLRRLDVQVARDEEGARLPACWWSRWEPLVVRLHYADGRDDGEQRLWLLVTPRRLWALLAVISSAILYGVVPWLSRTILEQGGVSAAWSRILSVLERAAVWQGLMLVVLALWLAIVASDRLQLWLRWRRVRAATRRDVQRYLEQVAESAAH